MRKYTNDRELPLLPIAHQTVPSTSAPNHTYRCCLDRLHNSTKRIAARSTRLGYINALRSTTETHSNTIISNWISPWTLTGEEPNGKQPMETLPVEDRLVSHNHQNTYSLSPYRSRLTNPNLQEPYQNANYRNQRCKRHAWNNRYYDKTPSTMESTEKVWRRKPDLSVTPTKSRLPCPTKLTPTCKNTKNAQPTGKASLPRNRTKRSPTMKHPEPLNREAERKVDLEKRQPPTS